MLKRVLPFLALAALVALLLSLCLRMHVVRHRHASGGPPRKTAANPVRVPDFGAVGIRVSF